MSIGRFGEGDVRFEDNFLNSDKSPKNLDDRESDFSDDARSEETFSSSPATSDIEELKAAKTGSLYCPKASKKAESLSSYARKFIDNLKALIQDKQTLTLEHLQKHNEKLHKELELFEKTALDHPTDIKPINTSDTASSSKSLGEKESNSPSLRSTSSGKLSKDQKEAHEIIEKAAQDVADSLRLVTAASVSSSESASNVEHSSEVSQNPSHSSEAHHKSESHEIGSIVVAGVSTGLSAFLLATEVRGMVTLYSDKKNISKSVDTLIADIHTLSTQINRYSKEKPSKDLDKKIDHLKNRKANLEIDLENAKKELKEVKDQIKEDGVNVAILTVKTGAEGTHLAFELIKTLAEVAAPFVLLGINVITLGMSIKGLAGNLLERFKLNKEIEEIQTRIEKLDGLDKLEKWLTIDAESNTKEPNVDREKLEAAKRAIEKDFSFSLDEEDNHKKFTEKLSELISLKNELKAVTEHSEENQKEIAQSVLNVSASALSVAHSTMVVLAIVGAGAGAGATAATGIGAVGLAGVAIGYMIYRNRKQILEFTQKTGHQISKRVNNLSSKATQIIKNQLSGQILSLSRAYLSNVRRYSDRNSSKLPTSVRQDLRKFEKEMEVLIRALFENFKQQNREIKFHDLMHSAPQL